MLQTCRKALKAAENLGPKFSILVLRCDKQTALDLEFEMVCAAPV